MYLRIGLLAALLGASASALTLREAEEIALRENPRLMATRLAALATQRRTEVGSFYIPRLDLLAAAVETPDGTRLGAVPNAINNPLIVSRVAMGGVITMPVTDFGRTSLEMAAAREGARAEQERSRLARAQILLAVRQAYWGLWRARQMEKAAGTQELEATLARNNRLIASMELATLLGRRPTEMLEAEDSPDTSVPVYDIEEITRRAIASSPVLEEQRHLCAVASSLAKAEKRAALPSIAAVLSGGYVPVSGLRFQGTTYRAVGLTASMPVLPWQPASARRGEAELRSEAAAASLRQAEGRVANDVAVAVVQINSAWTTLAMARRSVAEAGTDPEKVQAASRLVAAEHDVAIRKAVLAFHTGVSEPE